MNALAGLLHGDAAQPATAPRWYAGAIALLSVYLVVYHIYIGVYGAPTNALYLPVHLLVALALLFIVHPLGRRWNEALRAISLVDLGCLAACGALLAYYLAIIDQQRGDEEGARSALREILRLAADHGHSDYVKAADKALRALDSGSTIQLPG